MAGEVTIPVHVLDRHWGYIYQELNTVTGDIYIGQHKHPKGEAFHKYRGSGQELAKDRTLYPADAFEKKILCFVESAAEADYEEIRHIATARLLRVQLRNLAHGGRRPIEQARMLGRLVGRAPDTRSYDREVVRLMNHASVTERLVIIKRLEQASGGFEKRAKKATTPPPKTSTPTALDLDRMFEDVVF